MDQTKITKLLRLMKLLTGNVYAMGKVARGLSDFNRLAADVKILERPGVTFNLSSNRAGPRKRHRPGDRQSHRCR